ncbi:phosphomannomutase/phosphoglucomutase [Oceanicoccus sp. KOV_DT_Chl]|uniref:phosphomannomutase/phosphoglucomutase n=1 Tax=Oceanicoccus sp. KOV_DT_Chl TaxID=1904639 RepID=UPI000C7D0881|nr:phosphomannomutase/phosphoglucomutase [Oceanicoccus sp. KOV_DT_Chl]
MAKKNPPKQKNASPAKPKNLLITTIINCTAISLLVTAAAFSYLALVERPAISNASIQAQAQSLADSQVSLLDQALTQLRLRLSNIALSEDLLAALEQSDPAALERYRLELKRAFPEAISSKLIPLGPLGIASLNKDSRELRNNIELDLLRSVSNGQNVEPEAYQYEDTWLFSVAESVQSTDKKYASAALLVTLDEQYLRSLLSQLDSALGQTQLIQQFKNKQHIIVSSGNGDPAITVVAEATVSQWRLHFSPSAELIAKSGHSSTTVWMLLAAAALAILGTGLFMLSSLQKVLAQNLTQLTSKSKDPSFTLPGFGTLAKKLQQIPSPAPAAAVTPAAKDNPEAKTDTAAKAVEDDSLAINLPAQLPASIFRAYDIRGIAETELTDEVVYAIGLAIGSEALDQGQQRIIISADGRHSSPRIRDAMVQGLRASGRDVVDIGIQPTPLMYFATHQLDTQSGVMITGSHNPAEYNGIKIVIGGRALSGQAIMALKERIESKSLATGAGDYHHQDVDQSYIDYIINDVAIAQPLKIVIDAGNGVAGAIAPQLFEELGCEVIPLYCEVNGDFPNHHPDPSVEANLTDLKQQVQEHKADLGIAFDGDGDRLGVVTATGKSVPADRLLMLLAQDVVSRNPGADVLFDVKCTRNLNTLISNYGGRPIMWKTGHSFMKEKMQETGALLGGEFSGHIFFKERWFGFDDGMYAAARLIEILSTTDPDLDLQLEAFPESISSPELKVETTDTQKFSIIEQLISNANFDDGKISTLDGLRVDFPDGWGLVRASNTTPMLILRFEADTDEAMERIQSQFKDQLSAIDNSLQFSF